MKLIDLLEVFDENKNLYVYMDDELLAYYDGKNNIPEGLNEHEVVRISTDLNGVSVDIRWKGQDNDRQATQSPQSSNTIYVRPCGKT